MAIDTTAESPPDSGRDRIMDEAATLFLQRGYEATSLRHLATVVGIKAGSIYYHFTSKDELLTEILRRGIAVMQVAFDQAEVASAGLPSTRRIEAHVRAHLAALYENGPYTAAHVMTFRTAPEVVREQIVPLRDQYEARWTTMLARAPGRRSDPSHRRRQRHASRVVRRDEFAPSSGSMPAAAISTSSPRPSPIKFWNGVAA